MKHPTRLAVMLAGSALAGLVGMMLVEGWWTWPCFALAAYPAALAAFGHVREQVKGTTAARR